MSESAIKCRLNSRRANYVMKSRVGILPTSKPWRRKHALRLVYGDIREQKLTFLVINADFGLVYRHLGHAHLAQCLSVVACQSVPRFGI